MAKRLLRLFCGWLCVAAGVVGTLRMTRQGQESANGDERVADHVSARVPTDRLRHDRGFALRAPADAGSGGWSYPREVTDVDTAENVIDRLLLALAAQLRPSEDPVLAAGAVEALAGLSRAQTERLFGQAGHLVHYGAETEALETLIHAISAIQRAETPADAVIKPGDEVRLVGQLPESLAEYDETWLRETVFLVRYVGRGPMVDVQSELSEDYMIATLSAANVEPIRR
jgi:hypothetical protein